MRPNQKSSALARQFFGIATGFVVLSVFIGNRNPLAPLGIDFAVDTRLVTLSISLGLAAILGTLFRGVPPIKWWGILGVGAVAWLVWSLYTRENFNEIVTIVVGAIFGLLATYFSFNSTARELTIFVWLPAMAALGLIFLFSVFQGPVGSGWFEGYGTGPISYGRLMASAALICIALAAYYARWRATFFALAFPFFLGAIMLSGSNGIQLSLGLALAVLLYGLHSNKEALWPVFVGTGLLIISMIVVGASSYFHNSFPGLTSLIEGSQARDSRIIPFYTSGRSAIWLRTFEEFDSAPDLIFGTGQVLISVGGNETHPHNLLLGLALAGGLISLVGLSGVGIVAFRTLLRRTHNPDFATHLPFVLFFFWFCSAMLSGDFRDNQALFLFLAILVGQEQRADIQTRSGRGYQMFPLI